MTLSWRISALAERHRALGSNLEDWNGMGTAWTYSSALADHHEAIRTRAGLMDVSGLKKSITWDPMPKACCNGRPPATSPNSTPANRCTPRCSTRTASSSMTASSTAPGLTRSWWCMALAPGRKCWCVPPWAGKWRCCSTTTCTTCRCKGRWRWTFSPSTCPASASCRTSITCRRACSNAR